MQPDINPHVSSDLAGHVSADPDSAEDTIDDSDAAVDEEEEEDDEEEVLVEEDQIQTSVRAGSLIVLRSGESWRGF